MSVSFGSCLHFEVSLLDLDFLGADLSQVELGGGAGDLLFACFALFGEMCEFRLEASKALVAVLQGEQLFDHIEHRPMMTGPLEIIQRAVWQAREEAMGGCRIEAAVRVEATPSVRSFLSGGVLADTP